jgi:D-alanyl-D-alanine carboxypeptidase/D-alanyl-D-alanine-endopeptidase (penicillin-binding protein 4)
MTQPRDVPRPWKDERVNLARWSRRQSWTVVGVLLAVVVLAAAAIFIWPQLMGGSAAGDDGAATGEIPTSQSGIDGTAGGDDGASSAPSAQPDPPVTAATLDITPMTPSEQAPTAAGVAARFAKPLANKALADLSGLVIDPVSGDVLWDKNSASPRVPASSMKLLTGAALLASADPNKRLVTKVVMGENPGEIVFVGGGDVTLSARAAGAGTVLPGGPTVADLAAQVKASGMDVKSITSIGVDTSYWSGPEMADGWNAEDIQGTPQSAQGFITKMQALMVDADRVDPANENSPRTGEPAITAGKALAHALGNDDIPISEATAPADAKVIAQVESQPLSTLLAQALEKSDNVLSEALAREVAIARGAVPSFAGVSGAFLQALGDLGLDTTGVVVKDGSGMSGGDKVPPALLGRLMAMAVAGEPAEQSVLLTGLPLAGVSGTLAENERFTQPETKAGRGWVRAKTGSLDATYALVGYVPDVDGRILVFAFNSDGVIGNQSRYAQDALATALRLCGCSGA